MKKKLLQLKNGITLVEVLLSIIILSIGIAVLMLATSKCLSVLKSAKNQNIVQNLIQELNVEYPIVKVDLQELYESGNFKEYDNFSWSREIKMVDEDDKPGLFLIKAKIYWTERGKNIFEEVNYYIYAPEAEII